ncbi:MAG: prepilin-type N-terminal cleavage/methylation domain-containing protein [Candidatus Hydrogenedentota bacterium]|nr:MAG: prepilin-type N-terminal cleavage/methylation domain-containing protein [Candidatus Hydrogenedentota bacterium]
MKRFYNPFYKVGKDSGRIFGGCWFWRRVSPAGEGSAEKERVVMIQRVGFRKQGGFTIIELTAVLLIIGILMAVAALSFRGNEEAAKITSARASLRNIQNALETYRLQKKYYPTGTDRVGLAKLVNAGLISEENLEDPWGNDYHYEPVPEDKPTGYRLESYGSDGVDGPEDPTLQMSSASADEEVQNLDEEALEGVDIPAPIDSRRHDWDDSNDNVEVQ